MRLGVDMDETVARMLSKILPLYNEKYNDTLHEEFIYTYSISQFLNPLCKNIFEEYATDSLIENMEVMDGAVEALTYLSKYHDIYFVTAGHPYTLKARDNWLNRVFSFYRSSNLIVCREKQLLNLDVLIDDWENNLIGGAYRRLLYTRPWNEKVATNLYGIERIHTWKEVPNTIESMNYNFT